jgi:hypothetical protein
MNHILGYIYLCVRAGRALKYVQHICVLYVAPNHWYGAHTHSTRSSFTSLVQCRHHPIKAAPIGQQLHFQLRWIDLTFANSTDT